MKLNSLLFCLAMLTLPLLHGEPNSSIEDLVGVREYIDSSIEVIEAKRPPPMEPTTATERDSQQAETLATTATTETPLGIISLDHGPEISQSPSEEEEEEDQHTRRLNLAAADDGAQVVSSNPECKWPERAIDADWEDSYVINP